MDFDKIRSVFLIIPNQPSRIPYTTTLLFLGFPSSRAIFHESSSSKSKRIREEAGSNRNMKLGKASFFILAAAGLADATQGGVRGLLNEKLYTRNSWNEQIGYCYGAVCGKFAVSSKA